MEMIKKLAKKEIKFAHGIALVFVVGIFATSILTYNYSKAFGMLNVSYGGKIFYISYNCTENPTGTCPQCPSCQQYGCSPTRWEIDFFTDGDGRSFICPSVRTYYEGSCAVGGNIIGEYFGFPTDIRQMGCDELDFSTY